MKDFAAAIGILAAMSLCLIAGCGESGPQLGDVSGTVTVDGQPVPGLSVQFEPKGGGPGSMGGTGSDGKYKIQFRRGTTGAVVGTHVVRVTVAETEEEGPTVTIPDKYNTQSELTFDVKPGENTFDIQIETQ